jgi:hypothetical protein
LGAGGVSVFLQDWCAVLYARYGVRVEAMLCWDETGWKMGIKMGVYEFYRGTNEKQ